MNGKTKLVSVSEMVAVEKEANASGISYAMMMENAGRGLAEQVEELYVFEKESGALGLIGSGNNGGDTLVALIYLAGWGWKTGAFLVRPREKNDPLLKRYLAAGGQVSDLAQGADIHNLIAQLPEYGVVLDGVLGTGFHLPLKGELAGVLLAVQQGLADLEDPPYVVAVDCPSGVDCDSGEAAEECIPADLTVTMAAIKQGLFRFPAYELTGDLRLVGIGLPDDGEFFHAWQEIRTFVPDEDEICALLPERPMDAHKGTFGTALIVAGSVSYTGAALLAGKGAYRIGAGLVTLALPAALHPALAGQFPEATWLLLPDQEGVITAQGADVINEGLNRATALLVGPGFGLAQSTADFIAGFFGDKSRALPPTVVDADGLKLLSRLPGWAADLPSPAVLTPHPGEMSVLTGLSKAEIQADRLGIARRYSQAWGHVVILKGAFTVIAEPGGEAMVIPVATPALARAGSGDVLAGLVVGLLAQGVAPYPAAVAAAWIHARAGLRAVLSVGNPASVLAGDILDAVVPVLNDLL